MKYLVLFAVLAVVYFLWRAKRVAPPASGQRAQPGRPQDMVRCAVCEVHLPRADAVAGADGRLFCSAEHRLQAGK